MNKLLGKLFDNQHMFITHLTFYSFINKVSTTLVNVSDTKKQWEVFCSNTDLSFSFIQCVFDVIP